MPFSDADLVASLPALRRYATSLTRNPAAAEDLVQDTMLYALGHRDNCQSVGWLTKTLRNCFLMDRRARKVRDAVPLEDAADVPVPSTAETRRELREVLALMTGRPQYGRLLWDAAVGGETPRPRQSSLCRSRQWLAQVAA